MAIVRSDPPQVLLAQDAEVLSRLVALRVIAQAHPEDFPAGVVERIREALLEERWVDALSEWIEVTGEPIDAYPDEEVWTEDRLDAERAALEIRFQRIFEGAGDD